MFLARLMDQPRRFAYRIDAKILKRIETKRGVKLKSFVSYSFRHWPSILAEWEAAQAESRFLYQKFNSRIKCLKVARNEIYRKRKPLDYILGWTPFAGLRFKVQPPVLLPRRDTESWLLQLVEELKEEEGLRILEVGSGTGCIAITLAKLSPSWNVTSIDKSEKAIRLAKTNAALNNIKSPTVGLDKKNVSRNVTKNLIITKCNVFDDLKVQSLGKFDLLISNPPYIPTRHWASRVSPNVRRWESSHALLAGADGCDFHKRLIEVAKASGIKRIVLELDGTIEQMKRVLQISKECGFERIKTFKDLCNRHRAILLNKIAD